VRSFRPRTIPGALGLRPIRDKPEGEGRIPGKIVLKQRDEAVSLTSPRDRIRLVRCN